MRTSAAFIIWTARRSLNVFSHSSFVNKSGKSGSFVGQLATLQAGAGKVRYFQESKFPLLESRDGDANKINTDKVRQSLIHSKNVHEILLHAIELLEENSAPEPTASACHLLSFALKNEFSWEDNGFAQLLKIISSKSYDRILSEKELSLLEFEDFLAMLERRIAKEPLQYIIGQWDFHDCVLKIRSPCLCPRPETEELVEYAGKDIQQMINILRIRGDTRNLRVLDVGCGTGAIGLSIAKMFPNDVEVFAIDVTEDAIELSRENSEFVLGKKSNYHDPVLSSAAEYSNHNGGKLGEILDFGYDLVVSNPPYIPLADMYTLDSDVIDFEDQRALCGGDDGLDVVRDILSRLPEWCESKLPRAFHPVCWMEVDDSHPILIEELAEDEENIKFIQGLKDFGGIDRFVKLEIFN